MNYKMIRFVLMRVLALLGVLFVFPFVTALLYHEENCARIFLVFALLCGLTGALHSRQRPENPVFYAREGFVMTVLSWIMISMIGRFPLFLQERFLPMWTPCLRRFPALPRREPAS